MNYFVEITEYAGIATAISGTTSIEILCAIDLSSFSEEVGYSVDTQTLDLLTDVSTTVRMPTVTFTPKLCIWVTWKIYRRSDSEDVSSTMSQVFNVGATELTITHSKDNFSRRKDLFGDHNREFYWKGFFNDRALTTTSEFPFELIFLDECRSASIIPKLITYPITKVTKSYEITVQPFTDTLDLE